MLIALLAILVHNSLIMIFSIDTLFSNALLLILVTLSGTITTLSVPVYFVRTPLESISKGEVLATSSKDISGNCGTISGTSGWGSSGMESSRLGVSD